MHPPEIRLATWFEAAGFVRKRMRRRSANPGTEAGDASDALGRHCQRPHGPNNEVNLARLAHRRDGYSNVSKANNKPPATIPAPVKYRPDNMIGTPTPRTPAATVQRPIMRAAAIVESFVACGSWAEVSSS